MSKSTYEIFGLNAKDVHEARALIEAALGIKLSPHESGYRSGLYFRGGAADGECFILQRNLDELDQEWNEPEHQDVEYLLYINETHRSVDIEGKLAESIEDIKLLRQESL